MIIANLSEVNGHHLATFGVKIARPHHKEKQLFENKFFPNPVSARNWATGRAKVFIKKEFSSFLKQRRTALIQVGMLNVNIASIITGLLRIEECNSLADTCRFVITHQQKFRILLPSLESTHHYWAAEIEELIHFSHSYITGGNPLWKY
ncbi:MAG: hypothetical protein L6Q78_11145 [Bacteroidia bacterium]|nr:hypothetical protein [Bacteroidia bacterium]